MPATLGPPGWLAGGPVGTNREALPSAAVGKPTSLDRVPLTGWAGEGATLDASQHWTCSSRGGGRAGAHCAWAANCVAGQPPPRVSEPHTTAAESTCLRAVWCGCGKGGDKLCRMCAGFGAFARLSRARESARVRAASRVARRAAAVGGPICAPTERVSRVLPGSPLVLVHAIGQRAARCQQAAAKLTRACGPGGPRRHAGAPGCPRRTSNLGFRHCDRG